MSSNNGLSILDLNVCNAFTKYDEIAHFVNRVNINNPISVICLNECWLSVQSNVSSLHIPNYDMYYQVGNCPGHTHCGLITYVYNSFKSNEININYDATGWEHLTIEISYISPNAKKYLVSNIYGPPEKYVADLDEFITEFSSFLNLLQHRIRTSLFVEISMLICWKFLLTRILIIILSLLFQKGFSPGLPYQQEYNPRHLVLLITSFVMISVEVNKFIVMEKNNEASINNVCNELGSLNDYDHLDKRLNLDPNDNYELFAGLIK